LQVASIETGAAVVTARVDEIIGYRWENLNEIIDPLADLLTPLSAHWHRRLEQWGCGVGVMNAPRPRQWGKERFFLKRGDLLDAIKIVKKQCRARDA
ncbi:hypothetical protein DK37_03195, partial [Halomonas sp. SUBG004]